MQEQNAEMPGDTWLPRGQYRSTRAITDDVAPEAVWPWLVQVGCGRARFYSHDLLDNLGRPRPAMLRGIERRADDLDPADRAGGRR